MQTSERFAVKSGEQQANDEDLQQESAADNAGSINYVAVGIGFEKLQFESSDGVVYGAAAQQAIQY